MSWFFRKELGQLNAEHVSRVPSWAAFKKAERRKGFCIVCDLPVANPRSVKCKDPDCVRVAESIYQRGYGQLRRSAARTSHA